MSQVMILMGSDSDIDYMKAAVEELKSAGVSFDIHVASAHRTPHRVMKLVTEAENGDCKVIIAGAGGAAHLAGVIASHTILPVIGVPLPTLGLGGADALLATVQMPRGVPVATVGMGNSANAALLAISIIGTADERLRNWLRDYRKAFEKKILEKDAKIKQQFQ
ncbi:5-(carboxyamino)imidazole ribonucleotide mutase [Myxococcota bacterium]|nr:5-(carboxyamino)imidazole ribonucleotide mutase [Myxococcota bacterium]MBU1379408.1 5-(carboxyamino)imidazole ribonucleotide mutase [Myxococcota bacterium]MBU1495354.1 5-(carboxyamino)imidazole ribonucleotide mutase [Myxococcota bacterium]